jgi:hypothetical protein
MKLFNRTLIVIFQPDFDQKISNAIVIAIEKLIRIDRTLIEHCLNGSAFPFDLDSGASARTLVAAPVVCHSHIWQRGTQYHDLPG